MQCHEVTVVVCKAAQKENKEPQWIKWQWCGGSGNSVTDSEPGTALSAVCRIMLYVISTLHMKKLRVVRYLSNNIQVANGRTRGRAQICQFHS